MIKEINERAARKLYEERKPFWMVASKLNPYGAGYHVDAAEYERLTDETFDSLVNAFRYYNCNIETGPRVIFYQET